MNARFLSAAAAVASGIIVTTVLVQFLSTSSAQRDAQTQQTQTPRYLPEYTSDGDLILPKGFHEWV